MAESTSETNSLGSDRHRAGQRLVNLDSVWRRIRTAAALPTLRIHDLRHVYAGMGAALGLGLPVVGKLLGHSQPQTTARYANLAPDPVHAAADAIGEALLQQMKKGQAKIIPFNQEGEVGDPEEGGANPG